VGNENDSVTNEFQNDLSGLRLQRLAALGEAARVQVSMHSLLQYEAQRIERKLGPQHTRTRQLQARRQSSVQLACALELKRQLTQIDMPEVADDGALVHGRIVDEDGLGIARLTVCLVDRSGTPTRDTGEPTSDASGYFAIPLGPEAVDRLNKQHPEGISLAVLTPRRRPVHQEPRPLALARGTRLLLTIRLRGFGPHYGRRAEAGTAQDEGDTESGQPGA
jgi:hypothetical protein